ncbi:MAG: RNA polymerase sigma factor [Planctomycetota bacterium]|jgi:RNA polymerase sigma-70 factor (ECF subfamily)
MELGQLDGYLQQEAVALQRCRDSSKEAFEAIVRRYMKQAYSIALGLVGNREDALDLSQEAFFRAYRNIKHLKAGRRFFPWFYQILRNLCFTHLRKRHRGRGEMPAYDEQDCPLPASGRFDPELVAERNETKDRVWRAIGMLDDKHREIIILRHFQDLSYEQMAQALFCSKGTVMSRLYHARQRLKKLLDLEKGGRQE